MLTNWSYTVDPKVTVNLRINEFLADNDGGIRDEDGNESDWIEIHNPDATAANLNGWFLTDEAINKKKWQFPAVTVPAGKQFAADYQAAGFKDGWSAYGLTSYDAGKAVVAALKQSLPNATDASSARAIASIAPSLASTRSPATPAFSAKVVHTEQIGLHA